MRQRSLVALFGAIVLLAALVWWSARNRSAETLESPLSSTQPAYADSRRCGECHPAQFQAWTDSHHDLAMQEASGETVLGDFDGSQFTHLGSTSRFFKNGEKFFVTTEGPDGTPADFEIRYTFGVDPLQQYLVEFPGGRLQCLQIAWDVERRRWFHLQADPIDPSDPFHWTGRYQNWNSRCAECHSTGLRKNYDVANDEYRTQWHDLDVGCQSCHGPGGAHVDWTREQRVSGDGRAGLSVAFDAKNPEREVDACAPCHSRRHRVGRDDRPGQSLMDDYMVATLREGLYHADGQILDEVYDYGSFIQSKMYHRGVRCSDCHDPHSLKLVADGNAVCVQCHQPSGNERFPTLQHKLYDSPDHHFHPLRSEGARCTACHMPETTYMMIDARADHSLRVPRPDLTVKIGTPNACTGCHADRPAQWAADAITRWYGNERLQEQHYGETLAAGRAGEPRAYSEIEQLSQDPDQPVIVRATALELLPQYGERAQRAIVASTTSQEPLIRATAVGLLDGLSPDRLAQIAIPLLDDSIRAVRIEAARVLAGIPADYFDARARTRFEMAIAEYADLQLSEAETPGAHLNLAVIHAAAGRYDLAEQEYLIALKIDADFLPARMNLANLYDQLGRAAEAEAMFRAALDRAQSSDKGEIYHSLGLLLAQGNRMEEAADCLGRASEALPTRARIRYNYALALQHLGRKVEAESALRDALGMDPSDPDIVNAMTVFYVQQGEWTRALPHAERLVELLPGAPEPARMLGHIREQVAKTQDGVK